MIKNVFTREQFDIAHEYFKRVLKQKTEIPEIKDFPDINKLFVNQNVKNEVKKCVELISFI